MATGKKASKEQCKRVITSYGAMDELLSFLTLGEKQSMQVGDRFCYEVMVSRVQTRIAVAKSQLKFVFDEPTRQFKRSVMRFDFRTKEQDRIEYRRSASFAEQISDSVQSWVASLPRSSMVADSFVIERGKDGLPRIVTSSFKSFQIDMIGGGQQPVNKTIGDPRQERNDWILGSVKVLEPASSMRSLNIHGLDMTAPVATAFFDSLGRSKISNLKEICLRFCLFEHASAASVDGLATFLARQKSLKIAWLLDGNFFTAEQTTKILAALARSSSMRNMEMLSLRHGNFETIEAATELCKMFAEA